ncbi:MAG: HNH endonuclease [Candidatus Rokuibacteriota bacterium]|nr:MAG: HNH endonuclease [Candidatus Rokubacteria bacterium]
MAPKPGCRVAPAQGGLSMQTLSLDRLGDEIAELSAHLDAATARLLDLIREYDARGGWNNGFRSCAAWLSWRVGFAPGAAREHVRVARALGPLPRLSHALARGELSYAKVRELTRVATPETEERLLAVGRAGTAEHVERIVRGWRRVDRKAEARDADRQHAGRALYVYPDEDGTVRIRGRLAPEVGALLMQALAAAREAVYPKNVPAGTCAPGVSQETPTMEQQQADALAFLAETALHHGIDPGAPGERYQVVVHVDAEVLAAADQAGQSVLEDGARVPAGTSQRLACDASRVVMRHTANGRVVEVGARTRTIPAALRRALHHRDRGCRFPGCGLRFGQGHHIRHWAQGGPTTLSNLALLCRRHHRAVHEEGYELDRQADGELRFRRPDGRVLPEVPLPHEVPDDPVQAIRGRHEAEGLVLHARTATPGWLGERLDVGWAIDVLHPLAR